MRPVLLLLLFACNRAVQTSPPPAIAREIGAPVDEDLQTADGAWVHLRRYPAAGPPVVLVHGISSNHRTWDLGPGRSLARTLQARGHDAWLLDLRGHGLASRDDQGRRQRAGWSMDDYGRYDLPAAIDHIRATTGVDRVACVGHSMGGMVAAIYNAWVGDEALASLVVVASPVDFGHPDTLMRLASEGSPVATALTPSLSTPLLARVAAWLPRSPLFVDPLLMDEDNVSPDTRRAMYRSIVSPMSRGELRQLRTMMAGGAFASVDGTVDYAAALADLHTPLLVIAGRGDRVAPPDRVAPYQQRAGSADKKLVIASRANGFTHDYGHLDLVVGDTAGDEIHPLIIDWIERHRR